MTTVKAYEPGYLIEGKDNVKSLGGSIHQLFSFIFNINEKLILSVKIFSKDEKVYNYPPNHSLIYLSNNL